jgi:hypothetical protein
LFSSSMANMAFGSGSMTVPSTSIAFFFLGHRRQASSGAVKTQVVDGALLLVGVSLPQRTRRPSQSPAQGNESVSDSSHSRQQRLLTGRVACYRAAFGRRAIGGARAGACSVRMRGPSAVMAMVFSQWAASEPSAVGDGPCRRSSRVPRAYRA